MERPAGACRGRLRQGEEVHGATAHRGAGLQSGPVRLPPRGGGDSGPHGPDSAVRGATGLAQCGD